MRKNDVTTKEQKWDKSAKIEAFLEELLRLISELGLEGYSISVLAKNAKVSRAWIYKMFGSQKEQLARQAALYYGKQFSILDNADLSATSREGLVKSLQRRTDVLISNSVQHPYLVILYFKHMGVKDPIGDAILELETEYIRKLSLLIQTTLKFERQVALQRARIFTISRMGLVYAWLQTKSPSKKDESSLRSDLEECVRIVFGE